MVICVSCLRCYGVVMLKIDKDGNKMSLLLAPSYLTAGVTADDKSVGFDAGPWTDASVYLWPICPPVCRVVCGLSVSLGLSVTCQWACLSVVDWLCLSAAVAGFSDSCGHCSLSVIVRRHSTESVGRCGHNAPD